MNSNGISYPNRSDFATYEEFAAATIAAFVNSDFNRQAVANAKEAYVAEELGCDRRTARAALKISGKW